MSSKSSELKIKAVLSQYLKSNKLNCSFENFKLNCLPFDLSILVEAKSFNIRRNYLKSFPLQFKYLNNLSEIDVSFNVFEYFPSEMANLSNLRSIQFHHNVISHIDKSIFDSLRKLEVLNLNHNCLVSFPESIGSCTQLKKLHLSHNQLTEFPESIERCQQLTELHMGYNKLLSVPESFGELIRLKKLILHKNQLECLPENIADMVSLKVLDIAANNIQILPNEINELPLNEFYYEQNPLLQLLPVSSQQVDEIMPLTELALRVVASELKNRGSYLHVKLKHFPVIQEMLEGSGECALCGGAYRDIWIECVQFVKRNPKFMTSQGCSKDIPIRVAICSYSCFNRKEHQFYGVASLQ